MALPQLFSIILTLSTALASIACAFYITRHCDALFWTLELNIPGIYTCYIYTHLLPNHPAHVCVCFSEYQQQQLLMIVAFFLQFLLYVMGDWEWC